MITKITEVIESFQNPAYRADVRLSIAKQFNLTHQSDEALLHIEQALQAIAFISNEEECNANALTCQAAEQLVKAGLHDRGLAMLEATLHQADAFEDSETRDYALIDIAEAYARLGQSDQAIQIGLMMDDDYKRVWRLFDSIAHIAVFEHSHHEQILNILTVIEDGGSKDHFLREAADTYSATNQLERALSLIPLMTYSSSKAETIADAVKNRIKTTPLNQLLDLLDQAKAYALAGQDLRMKAQALWMIAERHITLKQLAHARPLLEQAQEFAIALSGGRLLEQHPRDYLLRGIAEALGKLTEYEVAAQTTNAMSDTVFRASTLANIVQQDSTREEPNPQLRAKTIQEISAKENALNGDNSHTADLQRVLLAKSWSKLNLFDRVQSIAEQISEPTLKALALRYAGIGVGESEYDCFERLSAACKSASEQSDFEEGLRILNRVLEEISSFDEGYRNSFLIRIVEAYFKLLSHVH
ncbi:MAG: hypothetical protein QNJ46_30470 [Leptolyngbyaceae cyanobacterium MO_188.B28]|nr:hypothetical protein [Leptolyngbyaceae cyanobacterium MO_188.B28]